MKNDGTFPTRPARDIVTSPLQPQTDHQRRKRERELYAIRRLLQRFVSVSPAKWSKVFPDEYFSRIGRLRGWNIDGWAPGKRTSAYSRLTNDLVYGRLAPGILQRLQAVNPTDGHGRRRRKHTQWLTSNAGHVALRDHFAQLLTLARAADSWSEFLRLVDKAIPKFDQDPDLFGFN